jgi:hypothetical protein
MTPRGGERSRGAEERGEERRSKKGRAEGKLLVLSKCIRKQTKCVP